MTQNKNNPAVPSSDHSDAFVEFLKSAGVIGDQKISDKRLRDIKQEKTKASYHCTTLLLRNYRKLAWALECFPMEVALELDKPLNDLDAILDGIDVETSLNNRKLESRLESIRRSRLMVDRLHEAVTFLQKKPGDGQKMYDIIYHTYISPEKLKTADLFDRLEISARHYYRLRTEAIELISLRLWSAASRELDLWLQICTMLDD